MKEDIGEQATTDLSRISDEEISEEFTKRFAIAGNFFDLDHLKMIYEIPSNFNWKDFVEFCNDNEGNAEQGNSIIDELLSIHLNDIKENI